MLQWPEPRVRERTGWEGKKVYREVNPSGVNGERKGVKIDKGGWFFLSIVLIQLLSLVVLLSTQLVSYFW